MNPYHQPVLYHESLEYIQPISGGRYIDGTIGAGGHAYGFLEASFPEGKLLGLDIDPRAITIARKTMAPFGSRCFIKNSSYEKILDEMHSLGWNCVNGIILDLGVSSMQVDQQNRGFSFLKEAPLDMRFDKNCRGPSAADLVNTLDERILADILWKYGEEPNAKRIAAAIIKNRPIATTTQLAEIIIKNYGRRYRRIHPATLTFQALRIYVNDELEVLKKGIRNSLKALCSGGRLVVITFHSLEDRIVKHFFREESKNCICPPEQIICNCNHERSLIIITKKAIKPTENEISNNSRASSAKMRVAEKI